MKPWVRKSLAWLRNIIFLVGLMFAFESGGTYGWIYYIGVWMIYPAYNLYKRREELHMALDLFDLQIDAIKHQYKKSKEKKDEKE